MSWIERIRRLTTLGPALILMAGCGGGDKSPTGPTPGPGPDGNSIEFQLVALGFVGLPADAKVEDCIMTRFYSGKIEIDPNSGVWQLRLQVNDDNYGDWGYK